jgi:hypothetical protein
VFNVPKPNYAYAKRQRELARTRKKEAKRHKHSSAASFSELVDIDGLVVYRPDSVDSPGEGKSGVVVIMQASDVSDEVERGIPVEAPDTDTDMLRDAQAGIAKWTRARNGDFYALMIELSSAAEREDLVGRLEKSIRQLSTE